MSEQPRSTFKPRRHRDDEKSSQLVGPVVAKQPSDEQPQQEKPPTVSQDITLDQEREVEKAPVVQGSALEATLQELAYPKTGRERGDGPDVKGRSLLNLEPIRMPEAGEGQPQI